MLIIDMLTDGPLRFRDLERRLETANTATLSARLKHMQTEGLISRHEASRADVTYELTVLGKKAVPILQAVNDFTAQSEKTPTTQ